MIGQSANVALCASGFESLKSACQRLRPDSFPCSSADTLFSVGAEMPDIDRALVVPHFDDFQVRSDGNLYALDASGVVGRPDQFSCGGWTGGTATHLMVGGLDGVVGGFRLGGNTAEPLPAMCCIRP